MEREAGNREIRKDVKKGREGREERKGEIVR